MSIPSDSPWRGCAANFHQPVTRKDIRGSQSLVTTVSSISRTCADKPLPRIVFRSSTNDEDICRSVFRWDITPHEEVFKNGFRAMRREGTSDKVYYSLGLYVRNGRDMLLDSRQHTNHVFISTTLSSNRLPTVNPGTWQRINRYEIYAPGGISMAATLGDRDSYPGQDEVCFVAGIAPQYIRAVQKFRLTSDHEYDASSRYIESRRANANLIVNENFNPQAHPQSLLNLQNPLFRYHDGDSGKDLPLNITIYPSPATDGNDTIKWYTGGVANFESYINAAFRSSRNNQAFIFMKKEYVLLEYAPDAMTNKVLIGPVHIAKGYPSLKNTVFQEGIDCAFGSHVDDEAFIFSGNLCAKINYASNVKDDKIIKGPVTIIEMFPFFKSKVFESGMDAAFESSTKHEAYLFKDNLYAHINYNNPSLIKIEPITQCFECLKGTIFESGIEAAFAMHVGDEAYLFKGDYYARFKFVPDSGDNHIMGGVQKIPHDWIGIDHFLPRKNQGVDDNGQT